MNALPTVERVRELLDYDQLTGIFTRRIAVANQHVGDRAGHVNKKDGYRRIWVDGSLQQAHRLAVYVMTGEMPDPSIDVDHENGRRDDNWFKNLRVGTRQFNLQNRRTSKSSATSRLLGAFTAPIGASKPWRSQIKLSTGKAKHLGLFDTEQAAHEAYVAAKRKLHAGCTL